MDKELEKRVGKAALRTLSFIKKETPVQTGRLRNSIVLEKREDGFVIGTNVNYAEHIELGVKPHIIVPKNKKALFWKGAKYPVKKVKHPGFEGRHVFLRATKEFEKFLSEELRK